MARMADESDRRRKLGTSHAGFGRESFVVSFIFEFLQFLPGPPVPSEPCMARSSGRLLYSVLPVGYNKVKSNSGTWVLPHLWTICIVSTTNHVQSTEYCSRMLPEVVEDSVVASIVSRSEAEDESMVIHHQQQTKVARALVGQESLKDRPRKNASRLFETPLTQRDGVKPSKPSSHQIAAFSTAKGPLRQRYGQVAAERG